jgi:cystathionine gamma-synthase
MRVFGRILPTSRAIILLKDVVGIDDPLQSGDLLWVETPLNPLGEARNIKHYADRVSEYALIDRRFGSSDFRAYFHIPKAHAAGAVMVVDATFAPPPLQDPFLWGADCVMHSASKYLGGHSDVLGGVLVVKSAREWTEVCIALHFISSA